MSKLAQIMLRMVIALGLALPLAAVAAAPASAAGPVTPFFADHSRACDYAYTEGKINWSPAVPGGALRVDAAGVLVDQPVFCAPPDPPIGSPFAEFTAYVRGQRVDHEVVSTTGLFQISLANGNSFELIDQVDVRVCRDFGPMLPAFTCGDTQTYRRPSIGPAE